MASLTTVIKREVSGEDQYQYVLDISHDEAQSLFSVLGLISGPRENSPRQQTEKIYSLFKREPTLDSQALRGVLSGTLWVAEHNNPF